MLPDMLPVWASFEPTAGGFQRNVLTTGPSECPEYAANIQLLNNNYFQNVIGNGLQDSKLKRHVNDGAYNNIIWIWETVYERIETPCMWCYLDGLVDVLAGIFGPVIFSI